MYQAMLLWFKSLKIIVKLRLAFAFLACIAFFVGLGGLWTTWLLEGRVSTAYQQDLPAVSTVKEAGLCQLKAVRVLLRVVLAAGDTEEIEKQNKDLRIALAGERAQLTLCKLKVRSAEGIAQLAAVEKLLPKFEKGAADIVSAAKAGDVIGFRSTITDLLPLTDQIQHAFDEVSKTTEAQSTRSQILTTLTYYGALLVMMPIIIVTAVLAAIMSYVMSNLIARPLARMALVLGAVAKGDLTQMLLVTSTDEMGKVAGGLNRALGSVRETLKQVSVSSNELRLTSESLASTASSLANGTQTQSANLDTTTSSLEQISATIRNSAANASRANELGARARSAAEKGDVAVVSAVAAMEEIRTSSDEISDILSAINDLAFQSNLLAINASIEAARAGEGGRSFAVVAGEMRSLAERSKNSARLIERLIAKSLDRVNNGSQLVNESGEALAEIIASVKMLSETVQEIDIACTQQSEGVEHVTGAMNNVDIVVQENSSKTLGLSSTAQELAMLAAGLTDTLAKFIFEGSNLTAATQKEPDDLDDSLDEVKDLATSIYQRARKTFAQR